MSEPLYERAELAREIVLEALDRARESELCSTESLERAADLLYDEPEGEHFLVVQEAGWAVDHPDSCTAGGRDVAGCLIGRDLKEWLSLQAVPPIDTGRYLVEYDADERKTRIVEQVDGPA